MTYDTIKELVGKTITKVEGGTKGDGEIILFLDNGDECRFYHSQECCETVRIEDVEGDWRDLIGNQLIVAEVCSNADSPDCRECGYGGSYTWTFYRFATIKGWVIVRWLGESNGYYSESVDIYYQKK